MLYFTPNFMFGRKIFKMDSSIFCVWPIFSTVGPCWAQGTETTLLNMFRTTSTFSFAKRMGKNSEVRAWSKRLDKSCKSRYTHLISRMHRGTDPLRVYKRVRTFCVWVRMAWTGTPRGQGRRPVPSHWHWCVPRDTWAWGVLWILWAGRQGVQANTP